jgi:hypothetical protein
VNTTIEGIPVQATINLNGTVSPTDQLSGQLTLNITVLGQSIPVNRTFTGAVAGNTIILNGSGTVPPIPGVPLPPGCSFGISVTGNRVDRQVPCEGERLATFPRVGPGVGLAERGVLSNPTEM